MPSKRTKVGVTENFISDEERGKWGDVINDVGGWEQPRFKTEAEFIERCALFKNLIAAKAQAPTVEKFARFQGTSFHKIRKWSKGEDCPESRRDAIQDIITWMAAIWADAQMNKLMTDTRYIWYSKNWFDMKEPDTRLAVDLVTPLKELQSAENVKMKYLKDLEESEKGAKKLPKLEEES